jgi:hypothetical protein
MNSFFTLHSFLEVGKTHDLPSEFWQTLGDALTGLSLELWNIVCVGLMIPKTLETSPHVITATSREMLKLQSILLSALSAQEYNRVNGLEIAKEIWDTLLIAHEGVDR